MLSTHLDFQQAKVNHLLFKSRLRAILYDQTPEDEAAVASQYACGVGRWLYSHALIAYETIPEVQALEAVHTAIHTTARELITHYRRGEVEVARQGLGRIEQQADELIRLLNRVETQVSAVDSPTALSTPTEAAEEEGQTLTSLLVQNQRLDAKLNAQSQELSQKEQIFSTIMGASPIVLWLSDAGGAVTYVNQTWVEWTGKPLAAHLGQGWTEAIVEEDRNRIAEQFLADLTARRPYAVEFRIRRSDGATRWCSVVGRPWFTSAGHFGGYAGSCIDVTEPVLARKRIEESEARFRALVEEAPVATCLFVGRELVIDVANELMIRFFGRGPSIVGKPVRAVLMAPGSDESAIALLEHVFLTGEPFTATAAPANLTIDGVADTYYFDFGLKPLRNAAGAVYAIVETAIDVTERVTAQQRIDQTQQQVLDSFEQAPVAIAVLTQPHLTYRMANAQYRKFISRPAEALLGKPLLEAVPEVAGQGVVELLEGVMATNTPYSATETAFAVQYSTGVETLYFNFTYQPWQQDNQTTGVMIVATEVTQRVLARQKLEESELFARNIVAGSPVANLVFVGENLVIQTINEHMLELVGRPASIIGKPFLDVMPELRGTPTVGWLKQVYDTGETYIQPEERLDLIRYGQPYTGYYNYIYKALRNTADVIYGVIVTATEVTQQVLARQQIEASEQQYRTLSAELDQQVQQRTQQLQASIGDLERSNENLQQFAYVASHDLQEPLRKIQQFGDILKTQYADALGDGVRYLERMQSAASRMSTLIKDLLGYSRIATQQSTTAMVSLQEVVESALTDLELRIRESGAVVHLEALPTLPGDATQLGQLFQNLLSNALKFRRADRQPVITIGCQTVASTALPPLVHPTRQTPTYYCINVRDNGIGFEEKYVDRIFQVFQRLHGRNEFAGTGIGLAICEKVAANHGGAITATSQPGEGATFSVYLPVEAE